MCWAIFVAPANASESTSAIRPISSAASASKDSPVKKILAALWYPTNAGKRKLEPASGTNPKDAKGIEKLAEGDATTTSQCKSIVVPTPTALPLTAAMSGLGKLSNAAKNWATSDESLVGGLSIKSTMSFPAVK